MKQSEFEFETFGPGLTEITGHVADWVQRESTSQHGLLTLFVRHTSASLLIQENADPDVQRDFLAYLERMVPQADMPTMSYLRHRSEGPDDMPAHIKAALLPTHLSIPVVAGQMVLGTWQGVFLVEHRTAPHNRRIRAVLT
jgi:secondary thiamine-phosphate synthase enzyme